MKFSNITVVIACAMISTLAISCAQDKNKKDNLRKIRPGSARALKPGTVVGPDACANAQAAVRQACPVAPEVSPTPAPDAATPTIVIDDKNKESNTDAAKPETTIEVTTEQCRITNDPKLSDEQKAQSMCDALVVLSAADGKIKFEQLHSLINIEASELKIEQAQITDKKVHFEIESKKSEGSSDKDVLMLTFKLPHTKDAIDSSKAIDVQLNGAAIPQDKLELVFEEGSNNLVVRIKDASIIENINHKITIEYLLK
jgi:hypothetical protein